MHCDGEKDVLKSGIKLKLLEKYCSSAVKIVVNCNLSVLKYAF
jgi:hypothetical protein